MYCELRSHLLNSTEQPLVSRPLFYVRTLSPGFDHRTVVVGTALLMVGNIMGQLASLAGLLLISRIYAPADVGLWAMFLGIGFMVPLLAGLRYDLAAIIVDDDRDAGRLVALTILLGTACALVALLVAVSLHFIQGGLIPADWVEISYAYAPYIFLSGILNAGTGWAVRKKLFAWLMMIRLGQPLVTLLLQYLYRDAPLFGNGLISGHVGGCLIVTLFYLPILRSAFKYAVEDMQSIRAFFADLKTIAKREKSFPLFSVPYALVGNFANQAVVVAMGAWYSLTIVGLFNMAFRTLNAPMMLIVSALGQAIMPVLSRAKNHIERYEDIVVSFLRLLGWVHIPPLVFIVVHGPAAYKFVFGDQWTEAGYYAGFLTLALFGSVLTQWLERIFDILGRQKLHLAVSIGLNGCVLLGFMVTHMLSGNPIHAVMAWSVGTLLYGMLWISIVFRLCGFHFASLLRVIMELGILAAVTMALINAAMAIESYTEHMAAVAVIFSFYGFGLWLFLKKDFGRIFTWKKAQS